MKRLHTAAALAVVLALIAGWAWDAFTKPVPPQLQKVSRQ